MRSGIIFTCGILSGTPMYVITMISGYSPDGRYLQVPDRKETIPRNKKQMKKEMDIMEIQA